jgi:magnesium transporter
LFFIFRQFERAVYLIFAAFAGVVLPSLLIRFKIDPALAGGVILTTITDVIGTTRN